MAIPDIHKPAAFVPPKVSRTLPKFQTLMKFTGTYFQDNESNPPSYTHNPPTYIHGQTTNTNVHNTMHLPFLSDYFFDNMIHGGK